MALKLKRRKPQKRLTHHQSIRALKLEIEQAENEAVTDYDLEALTDESIPVEIKLRTEGDIDWDKFKARSRVVKRARADAQKFINYIQKKHKSELNFSKKKRYPWQWMLNDKKINTVIESRPIIFDFLNYLFNYNRYFSKEKRKEMFELTDEITGGKMHNDKYPYAALVADAEFWHKAAAALGYSESRLKRVLGEFCKAGIVIQLGEVCTLKRGRPPGLYADGYFTKFNDRDTKKAFLKNSPEYREALRGLTQKNLGRPKSLIDYLIDNPELILCQP